MKEPSSMTAPYHPLQEVLQDFFLAAGRPRHSRRRPVRPRRLAGLALDHGKLLGRLDGAKNVSGLQRFPVTLHLQAEPTGAAGT
jgi:hypothetical protein